jgi:hypothetical protein
MQINEKWSISADSLQFIVIRHVPGFNAKTKQDVIRTSQTYHPTIEACLNHIARSESMAALEDGTVTITDLKETLNTMHVKIKEIADATQMAIQADRKSTNTAD